MAPMQFSEIMCVYSVYVWLYVSVGCWC